MGVAASDTFYSFLTFASAHNAQIVDENGKIVLDQPKNRAAMIAAVKDYASIAEKGCTPPSSVNWLDPDNNVAFHNKQTIGTHNATISIAGKWLDDSKNQSLTAEQLATADDNYKNKVRTIGFPKKPGGNAVMNFALATYLIPAAFLAVPMYKAMCQYGLLNSQWSLILAMVTLASPYAIWVLKQASDKLLFELDEAAIMDGATPLQIFRLVYLPLMKPSLLAIGTYALLLAWNEYLYAFLLFSKDSDVTLAVALGHFLSADDSPWNLLMATGLVYALPPAAIYHAFRNYMVGGLTAGATKG